MKQKGLHVPRAQPEKPNTSQTKQTTKKNLETRERKKKNTLEKLLCFFNSEAGIILYLKPMRNREEVKVC